MQAATDGEECYAYSSRRMHTIPEGHAPLAKEDILSMHITSSYIL